MNFTNSSFVFAFVITVLIAAISLIFQLIMRSTALYSRALMSFAFFFCFGGRVDRPYF